MDWRLKFLGPNFFRTAAGVGMCRCPHCRRCMDFADAISRRNFRTDVIDAGFACKCGEWVHAFYETPAIELGQQALRDVNQRGTPELKADTEMNWRALFVAEQERVKEELAV